MYKQASRTYQRDLCFCLGLILEVANHILCAPLFAYPTIPASTLSSLLHSTPIPHPSLSPLLPTQRKKQGCSSVQLDHTSSITTSDTIYAPSPKSCLAEHDSTTLPEPWPKDSMSSSSGSLQKYPTLARLVSFFSSPSHCGFTFFVGRSWRTRHC